MKKFLKRAMLPLAIAASAVGLAIPIATATTVGDYTCILPLDGVRHNCGGVSSPATTISVQAMTSTAPNPNDPVNYKVWANRYNGSTWTIYGPWVYAGSSVHTISFATAQQTQMSISLYGGLYGSMKFYGVFSR